MKPWRTFRKETPKRKISTDSVQIDRTIYAEIQGDGQIGGLFYSLVILENRKFLNCHPAYMAALDDIKIFIEASIERLESGESVFSTATTQDVDKR